MESRTADSPCVVPPDADEHSAAAEISMSERKRRKSWLWKRLERQMKADAPEAGLEVRPGKDEGASGNTKSTNGANEAAEPSEVKKTPLLKLSKKGV